MFILLHYVSQSYFRGCGTDDESVFYLPPSDHGRLWFSVIFDAASEQLQVTLIKVRELTGRGRDSLIRDPFVKVFLLPDERNCRVSKVKKKTLCPIYNETFTFQVLMIIKIFDVYQHNLQYKIHSQFLTLSTCHTKTRVVECFF